MKRTQAEKVKAMKKRQKLKGWIKDDEERKRWKECGEREKGKSGVKSNKKRWREEKIVK